MRVLFLSPRQCWPVLTGARLREFHFLRALGNWGSVTYVYFRDPAGPALSAADVPFCEQIVAVDKPKMYTPVKILQGVAGARPLPVINYSSAPMSEALRGLMRERTFDVAHLDSIHMSGYEGVLGGLPIIYNWHNIESEAMRRFGELSPSLPRRAYARITASRLEALERRVLTRAAGHVVCSEREKNELFSWDARARVAVAENGVDTAYYAQAGSSDRKSALVFVGSMAYHANAEAAVYFARNHWPAIHAKFPAWKFQIVGSQPGAEVSALAELPDVEVTGTVPDVRPYYAGALAAVVPLRTGGGTRLKILEAMAAGVPVISTAIGAEGLAAVPEQDYLLTNSDEWLQPVARLAEEPALRERLVTAGQRLVTSRYDWGIIGESLCHTYSQWLT